MTLDQLEAVKERVNSRLKDLSVPIEINTNFVVMLNILLHELSTLPASDTGDTSTEP